MQPIPTVPELLQPLYLRLFALRRRRGDSQSRNQAISTFERIEAIFMILPPQEAGRAFEIALARIQDLERADVKDYVANLSEDEIGELIDNEWFADGEDFVVAERINTEIADELTDYKHRLHEFIVKIEQYSKEGQKKVAINNGEDRPIIKLSDAPTIKELERAGFEPKFSVDDIALLLRYLRDLDFLPQLAKGDLGEIAVLFGRSKQNVRIAYKALDNRASEAYNAGRNSLKRHLQDIIQEIDRELQPVQRL